MARAIRKGARYAAEKHARAPRQLTDEQRAAIGRRSWWGPVILTLVVFAVVVFLARWAHAADGVPAAPSPAWSDVAAGVFLVICGLAVAALLAEIALFVFSFFTRRDRP
jgi:hypothetical protein